MTIKNTKKLMNAGSDQTNSKHELNNRTQKSTCLYFNENTGSSQQNYEDIINGLTETNYKALYKSPETYLDRINIRALFSQQFLIDQYESLLEKGYTNLAAKYYQQLENYAVIEQLSQHLEHHYGNELIDVRVFDKEVN
ncbi:MAG: hypothetical protein ABF643_08330 [Oenococcus oeni]